MTATGTRAPGPTSVDLGDGPSALVGLRGRRISLLLQNPFTSLSPVHRCGPQIAATLPPSLRTDAEIARGSTRSTCRTGWPGSYPFELSGGMRQRVALAASLAADPEVLIGDEPTTALDVTTQREVLDLLAPHPAGARRWPLLLITHDLGVARERADRILVMYAGRLVETGPGADLFDHHGTRTPRPPRQRAALGVTASNDCPRSSAPCPGRGRSPTAACSHRAARAPTSTAGTHEPTARRGRRRGSPAGSRLAAGERGAADSRVHETTR